MKNDEMIILGQIVAPHGVRGEVRIRPETDRPEIFSTLREVYIDGNKYAVLKTRPHKNLICCTCAGITNRSEAEVLNGALVAVPFVMLPSREEGNYYIFDIVGLAVYDLNEKKIGKVKEVIQPGANDVYVVELDNEGPEILVPALKSVVKKIDLDAKIMIVSLPEWEETK